MYDSHPMIEAEARHQIADRITRAAEPHLPPVSPRRRLAQRLRRVADRVDN